jgi:TolA-binding protein
MNAFTETPPRAELSPDAAKVLGNIPPAGNRAGPLRKPRVFNQDLETPAGGEEHTLRSIVQGSFSRKEWESARDELIRYLALPRSSLPEARARFYLGQCYYFTGAYRESLFEFLSVQSIYPAEAAEWIRPVLNLLAGN